MSQSANPPPSSTAQALASISAAVSSLSAQQSALQSQAAQLSGNTASSSTSPPSYKIIGIVLALASGLFIGSSFVFKKKGLLKSQEKVIQNGGNAGESHAYLKSPMWWTGMSLMIVGEICNFVAYAFADAVLVTPMGALSVVICAILSSIFLKERLTFFGKLGCLLCILGATIIAVNAPQEQAVSTIPQFQKLFLSPGFLVFGCIIIASAILLVLVVAPRWGKSNMLVYITICSIIGGLSVVSTQGLGASIVTSIKGDNQFKHWFIYFLAGFVICTLLTEINYLNKALELFNTAMVTPTYYVMFTFSTLVSSIILFQGLNAPVLDIVTLVLGFLVICAGITLLQMSKIDPSQLSGLSRRSTVYLGVDKTPENDPHQDLASHELEELPAIPRLDSLRGIIGSIHRTSLLGRAHHSGVGDPSAAQRRRESLLLKGGNDLEMSSSGLKRHSLWDNPIEDIVTKRCESPISIRGSSRDRIHHHQKTLEGYSRPENLTKFQNVGKGSGLSGREDGLGSFKTGSYVDSEEGSRPEASSSSPSDHYSPPPPLAPPLVSTQNHSIRFVGGDQKAYGESYHDHQSMSFPPAGKLVSSSKKVRPVVKPVLTPGPTSPKTLTNLLGLGNASLPTSSESRQTTILGPSVSFPGTCAGAGGGTGNLKKRYVPNEDDEEEEGRSLVRQGSDGSRSSASADIEGGAKASDENGGEVSCVNVVLPL